MRALRISGPRQVELVEAPVPTPRADEILVRVAFAGICATDRKLARRGSDVPRIPGHETAGWLEDGTPVGIHPDIGCDRCRHCRAGFENRCRQRISVGLDRDGGMADWVAVPGTHVLPVDDLDLEVAALLEPLACCLHASALLDVRDGSAALVVGAGPMGILGMWSLQSEGARVAVCETSGSRRQAATELGADAVLDPDEDLVAVLGAAPSYAIVTAPGPQALGWALDRMEPGGTVHVFAGSPGVNAVDANIVHYRHLALVGSTGSTMRDYRRALSLVRAGTLPLSRLPRSVVTLEEAAAALREPDVTSDTRSIIEMGRSSEG